MKRAIAIVTLACGAGVQAVVPDCPAGTAGSPVHAEAHTGSHPGGAVHGAETDAPGDHHPDEHPGSTCTLMSACGSAGLAVRAPASALGAAAVSKWYARTPPGPAPSVFPTHEPPPPRLSI